MDSLRKGLIILVLILVQILTGCKSSITEFSEKFPGKLSPDKKALIYQSGFPENGQYKISLVTWVETSIGTGGAGIFDIQSMNQDTLQINWLSDSSVIIIYPKNIQILRQDTFTYFGGRATHIRYIEAQSR